MEKQIWHPKEWLDSVFGLSALMLAVVLAGLSEAKIQGDAEIPWTEILLVAALYLLVVEIANILYGHTSYRLLA